MADPQLKPFVYDDVVIGEELGSYEYLLTQEMLDALPIVVNCTGLGAKDIFGDDELVPLRGQLTSITPQPDVNYGTLGGAHASTDFPIHMMPRSDGLILGGTSEQGEWSLDVNEEARQRIVDGHIELFDAMRAMAPGRAT